MTYRSMIEMMQEMEKNEHTLIMTKGKEYARSEDCLAHFIRQGKAVGIDPTQVCGLHLAKHIDAILKGVSDGSAANPVIRTETLESRISDARNYLAFMQALLRRRDDGSSCLPPPADRAEADAFPDSVPCLSPDYCGDMEHRV